MELDFQANLEKMSKDHEVKLAEKKRQEKKRR